MVIPRPWERAKEEETGGKRIMMSRTKEEDVEIEDGNEGRMAMIERRKRKRSIERKGRKSLGENRRKASDTKLRL